jgi:hypothetical protein
MNTRYPIHPDGLCGLAQSCPTVQLNLNNDRTNPFWIWKELIYFVRKMLKVFKKQDYIVAYPPLDEILLRLLFKFNP